MRSRRWIVLAILCAARATTGFQFQTAASVSDSLMTLLDAGHAHVGLLLGAYLLPGVIVALPAGWIGQRLRDRSLALGGLALMVLSGLAQGGADSFGMAMFARLAGGVGATIVVLVATKLTTDWFEGREIVVAMSILQMSWPFGAMLALPVQAMVREEWGWQAVMFSASICAALVMCAVLVMPGRTGKPTLLDNRRRSALPGVLWMPLVTAGLIWGMMNLSCVLFFSYAPPLLISFGYSPTAAASLTGLSIWLTILAIPTGGYLVHRSGNPLAAIRLCGLLAALLLLLLATGQSPVLACLAFGLFIGPLSGAILALPASILPEHHRSVGFGLFYTCFYLLMAIGPSIAGRLQDVTGASAAPFIAGACLLAGMTPLSVVFAALARRMAEASPGLPAGKQEATV